MADKITSTVPPFLPLVRHLPKIGLYVTPVVVSSNRQSCAVALPRFFLLLSPRRGAWHTTISPKKTSSSTSIVASPPHCTTNRSSGLFTVCEKVVNAMPTCLAVSSILPSLTPAKKGETAMTSPPIRALACREFCACREWENNKSPIFTLCSFSAVKLFISVWRTAA